MIKSIYIKHQIDYIYKDLNNYPCIIIFFKLGINILNYNFKIIKLIVKPRII